MEFTDDNKALTQEARNLKAKQLRVCRHYLHYARKVSNLPPDAPTIKFWENELETWRYATLQHIIDRFLKKETR